MSSSPRSSSSSHEETWCFVENSLGDMLDYSAELTVGGMPDHSTESPEINEPSEVKRKTTTSSVESLIAPVETSAEEEIDVISEEPKPEEKESPKVELLSTSEEPKPEEKEQPELERFKQHQSARLLWEAKIISAFAILFMLFWSIPLSIATPGDVLLFIRIAKLKAFGHSDSVPQGNDHLESFDLYNSIGSADYARSYLSTPLQLYSTEKRGANFIMKPEMDYIEIPPPQVVVSEIVPKIPTLELPSGERCMKPVEESLDIPRFARKYHKSSTSTMSTTTPTTRSSQLLLPSMRCTAPGFARVCEASTPSTSTPTTSMPTTRSSQLLLPSKRCAVPGFARVCDEASTPTTSTPTTRSSQLLLPSKRCTALKSYKFVSKSSMTRTKSTLGFGNRSSDLQNYTAVSSPSDVKEVANVSLSARSSSSNSTADLANIKGELGAPCIQSKDIEVVLTSAAGQIHTLTQEVNATKTSLFQCNAARRMLEKELQEEKSRRAVALGEVQNAIEEMAQLKQTRTHLLEAAAGALTANGRDVEEKCNCNCNCKCEEKDYYAALASSNESSCTVTTSVATVDNANTCAVESRFQEQVSTKQLKAMEKRHRGEMKRRNAEHASEMVDVVARYEKKLEELRTKMYVK